MGCAVVDRNPVKIPCGLVDYFLFVPLKKDRFTFFFRNFPSSFGSPSVLEAHQVHFFFVIAVLGRFPFPFRNREKKKRRKESQKKKRRKPLRKRTWSVSFNEPWPWQFKSVESKLFGEEVS